MPRFPESIPASIQEAQHAEFERERESFEQHRAEAKRMANALLARDAQILVLDVSQGGPTPEQVGDPVLFDQMRERQFGGASITNGEIFRNLLGFDPNDPRVTIWDIAREPDRKAMPFPDVWITTGGPAMPSELEPGNETENTTWLRRAVSAQRELAQAGVPGIAVCLGHQLWEYGRGAKVGKRRPAREFGTTRMSGTEAGKEMQLLFGFWDGEGGVDIAASHSESVITPPPTENLQVIAFNEYSDYQGAAHPLRSDQPIEEALNEDAVVLSMQNHPEVLALYLSIVRNIRAEAMRAEGLEPDQMLFRNTPNARKIWLRFIELAARRLEKRKK